MLGGGVLGGRCCSARRRTISSFCSSSWRRKAVISDRNASFSLLRATASISSTDRSLIILKASCWVLGSVAIGVDEKLGGGGLLSSCEEKRMGNGGEGRLPPSSSKIGPSSKGRE